MNLSILSMTSLPYALSRSYHRGKQNPMLPRRDSVTSVHTYAAHLVGWHSIQIKTCLVSHALKISCLSHSYLRKLHVGDFLKKKTASYNNKHYLFLKAIEVSPSKCTGASILKHFCDILLQVTSTTSRTVLQPL